MRERKYLSADCPQPCMATKRKWKEVHFSYVGACRVRKEPEKDLSAEYRC